MASYNNNAFGSGVSSLHNNVVGSVASAGIMDAFLHKLHARESGKTQLMVEQQRAWNQQTLQDRAHEQEKERMKMKNDWGNENESKKHDLARESYTQHGLISPGFQEAKNSRGMQFHQAISSAANQLNVDLQDPGVIPHLVRALAGYNSSTSASSSAPAASAAPATSSAPATSAPSSSSGSGTASSSTTRRTRNATKHTGATASSTAKPTSTKTTAAKPAKPAKATKTATATPPDTEEK